jgi:addiction module RelE/StbE family toxin
VTPIVWAPQAIEDVEAIRTYLAHDSPHYAELVVQRIIVAVTRLASHPLSGRVVPEVNDESIREVVHGSYRIVYRLRLPDVVEIVTVFHGARLFRLD